MSWSEFWSMGGYGFYVWGSYLTTLIGLGGEVVLLMKRRKSLRKPKSMLPAGLKEVGLTASSASNMRDA
jgi:heme exporter protein D